jgi:hypothetical protein
VMGGPVDIEKTREAWRSSNAGASSSLFRQRPRPGCCRTDPTAPRDR